MINKVIMSNQYNIPNICELDNKVLMNDNTYNGPLYYNSVFKMPVKPDSIYSQYLLSSYKKDIPLKLSLRNSIHHNIERAGFRNQGGCGASWAFSTVSVLSDRYAIKYKIPNPYLSVAWVLCNEFINTNSCNIKNNTYDTAKWIENNYVKNESCWPFKIIKNNNYDSNILINNLDNCCYDCCDNSLNINVKFSILPNSIKYIGITDNNNQIDINNTIKAIQINILTFGPIVSTFKVYEDFIDYWENKAILGEIYTPKTNKLIGIQSVSITGWGIENNIRYWEIRNSWGYSGDNGYCKIAFSTNDTPYNLLTGIDIPIYDGKHFNGGTISFEPNILPNYDYFKFTNIFKVDNKLYILLFFIFLFFVISIIKPYFFRG